jgi:anti-sigma B factor antagonist
MLRPTVLRVLPPEPPAPRRFEDGILDVESHDVGRRRVIELEGELDLSNTETVSRALGQAIADGVMEICVDLTELGFIDSTGLRVLLDAHEAARAAGRRMPIVCPHGSVLDVFMLAGVADRLDLHATRGQALA